MSTESIKPSSWPAILGYGFRPFFLLAGIHAAIAIPLWLVSLLGHGSYRSPLLPLAWHAHEMLFGFILATVAGFLLTAVPSWTGQRGYAGAPLLGLTMLWIAGRLVTSLPLGLPALTIALIDLTFIPVLALTILPALIRSGNLRNSVFIAMLAALFTANLHFHLAGATSVEPLLLAINVILLMVAMVGGRILPAFTSSGLKQQGIDVKIRRYPPLDIAALMATFSIIVIDIFFQGTTLAALAATLAAALLALRLARWQGHRSFKDPIIWVLHIAYAWLPVGLALKAAWLFGAPIPDTSWLHALTTGAFSTMILAVMSRVALGHTGRELAAPRLIVIAYYLITIAALLRVFGPMLYAQAWQFWMIASGLSWSSAFILFILVYAPILCRQRADGRAG
ncbi:NnrS family protein [Gammaproteobacteria bacterium]|nr:NnrS family protein [Gammaproteobacteria bacterium]